MAASDLKTLLDMRGLKTVGDALRRALGDPSDKLKDPIWYRQMVINPSWDATPLPFQMVGRDQLRWDEFFEELRKEVFATPGGRIALRPDWETVVSAILARFGPSPTSAPITVVKPSTSSKANPKSATKAEPRFDDDEVQSEIDTALDLEPFKDVVREIPPDEVIDPETLKIAVGIDLGTTYSVVAHIDRQGRPTSIVNSNGDVLTPSVVLFDGEDIVVGKEAVAAAAFEPDNVADCVKRDMGGKAYRKPIRGSTMPPEVISSLILKKLKTDAERKIGPFRKAVVTVPAYFDEPRRQATATAGELAGLEVIDIINEPTAAAIAYGHQIGMMDADGEVREPMTVLVYDLGGGTFDVTIVELAGKKFRAIATDGDVFLGGKDWDSRLVDLAADRFRSKHREDPRTNPQTSQELILSAENCKKTLTERPKASIIVNHLGTREKVDITREEFEFATQDLLARTQITTEIVLQQANLTWDKIKKILLVGGSTRMPMVSKMLEQMSGRAPDQTLSADEAVAHGAALYADLLLKKQGRSDGHTSTSISIININSHSLGILGVNPQTKERFNEIIIPKNTPLPHTVTRRFATMKADQKSVRVRVLEGESEFPAACTHVGDCVIRDLPAGLAQHWPVEVKYSYQQNGRLKVSAKLIGVEANVSTEFRRENVMEDSQVAFWAKLVAGVVS